MIYLSPKMSIYAAIQMAADNNLSFKQDGRGNLVMEPKPLRPRIYYETETAPLKEISTCKA